MGLSASGPIQLKKQNNKKILPDKTIAFTVFCKILTCVCNSDEKILSSNKKREEYSDLYLVGKNFKVENGKLSFFNSQANKSYNIRANRPHLNDVNESNFVFEPTFLKKLSERIL